MHDDHTPPPEQAPDAAPEDSSAAADSSGDAPSYSAWQDVSDGDLILYTRAGDGSAFGELWRRHARAGRTVARSFTSSLDPDDLVQESFAKIYQALQKGGGPTGAFRPYLFTTIRNTASAWGRARREASIDTLESFEDPASRDEETMAALDRSLTATAFRSLPTRWQEVLWYCEVEQMTPQQVAPLLAMKPNAVAALAYRAREGLRQAWIQAHIAAVPEDSEHRWTIERIGSYTRGSLGKRDTSKIEAHLDACARCTIVAAEAKEVGSRIALVLLPLAAGTVGASGYLAWLQTGAHTALTTAAMPAAVIGGHGMSLGSPIDPTALASIGGSAGAAAGSGAAGSGAAGSGAAGSGAAGSGAGAAGSGAAASSAAVVSTGAVSAGAISTGIVSGAIALVAAGAVAAAFAFSPSAATSSAEPVAGGTTTESSEYTQPPSDDGGNSIPSSGGGAPMTFTPEPEETQAPDTSDSPASSTDPKPTQDQPGQEPTPGPTPDPTPAPTPAPTPEPTPTPTPEPTPTEPALPAAPLIASADSGPHGEFFPILSGTSEPEALITVVDGEGDVLSQFTSDASGAWTSPQLSDLEAGTTTVSVRQTTEKGTSPASSVETRVSDAPTFVSPTDGDVISPFDLTLRLSDGAPGSTITGWVDGTPYFSCTMDEAGTNSACDWNDGVNWLELGLGPHTISIAHSDGHGRFGPQRSIDVIASLFAANAAATDPAGVSGD